MMKIWIFGGCRISWSSGTAEGMTLQTKGLDTVKRWAWALEMDHQRQVQKEKDMQAPQQKKNLVFFRGMIEPARPAPCPGIG